MFRSLLLLTVAFLFLSEALLVENSFQSAPIPVLFWSGADHFSGQNNQLLSTVRPSNIETTLSALLGLSSENNELLNPSSTSLPEVVLVFLEPKLTTALLEQLAGSYGAHDGGALPNLRRLVEGARSSVTAPYGSLEGYWRPFLSLASHLAPALVARQSSLLLSSFAAESEFSPLVGRGASSVSPAALSEYLAQHAELFSNGQPDLLLVEFDHSTASLDREAFSSDDTFVEAVTSAVAKATSGNYAALFAGMTPVYSDAYLHVAGGESDQTIDNYLRNLYAVQQSPSNTTDTNNTFFPTPVVEGLLCSLVLLVILLAGIYCAFSLQSPDRFEGGQVRPGYHAKGGAGHHAAAGAPAVN